MEKYTYSQQWFLGSEIKYNLLNFIDKSKKHTILEIGCFEGLSSVYFADNLLDNNDSSLTCVDPFLNIDNNDHARFLCDNQEKNFDYNISVCNNSEKIEINKITSDEFFKRNKKTFNFIYIDGCHECDFITRDMENSFNVLENDGIMWMDDYGGGNGINIKNTMNHFLDKYKGLYDLIHRGYQLAIRKKSRIINIKMIGHFWNNSKVLCDEFNLMIPSRDYTFNNIKITHEDNNIDYYVIINKPPNSSVHYDPAKTLVFIMEPSLYNLGDFSNLDKKNFLYINDYNEHLNVVQWRLKMEYSELIKNHHKTNNRVASIVSYKSYYEGHKIRLKFLHYLENNNIEGGESSLNDVYGMENYHHYKNYKGRVENDEVENVLLSYKYYFLPENSNEKNYATEKIWEPILCEALCFYWGCPNLEDYIDSRAFVRLPLDNFEESLLIIKKAIEEDWWSQRIDIIRQEKKKILNNLGFFNKLEKIIKH
jgi:hypothetical protein